MNETSKVSVYTFYVLGNECFIFDSEFWAAENPDNHSKHDCIFEVNARSLTDALLSFLNNPGIPDDLKEPFNDKYIHELI